MERRRFLLGSGAALAALLAACGGAPASPPPKLATRAARPSPQASGASPTTAATTAVANPPTATALPPAQTPTSAALVPTPTPTQTAAGRVVVVLGQQPDTLMPRLGSAMARAEVLGALHVEPVRADDKGSWVAMGVESVPTLENGGARWVGDGDDRHLEVTFKVRKGLKWHDGQPVTAADMRFHWSLVMNPKFGADDRTAEKKVNAVDVLDDQTAVYKYHSARQARDAAARGFMGLPPDEFKDWRDAKDPIVDALFMTVGGFLPEHILGKLDPSAVGSDFGRKPVLAGPYRFKEWVPDQTITLEAVPDHPLGAPSIGTVVFRIMRDPSAQIAALQAGEVDVLTQVQGPDVDRAPELDRFQVQGSYKVYYVPGTPWEHLDFNLDNDHLRDKNVRKAIAHGVDRQQIVDKLLYGKTKVATSWVQPGLPSWAYSDDAVVKYPFDQAKAKALLADAGYSAGPDGILVKAGKKLQLKLSTTDAALRRSIAQMVQQQLKAVGIGIEVEFLPGRALFDQKGPLKTRQFDVALYTWLAQMNPDRSDYLHSKSVPSASNGYNGNNYMDYSNPRVDQLLVQGASLVSEKDRQPVYLEMQKIVTDDLPFLPLFQRVTPMVARASLRNFKPTPTTTPETWNIYEWALG